LSPDNRRSRPRHESGSKTPAKKSVPSLPLTSELRPDLEVLAARQTFVIRVATSLANGQTRVQHYTSLHAAVKSEERARARGCYAVLTLARVVPVGIVTQAELEALRSDVR